MSLIDRLVHPVKLSIKNSARGGADAIIEYTGTNWLLLAGSKICTEYAPSALNEDYNLKLESQRKWAVADTGVVLKSCLEDYRLYNKYIAHYNYYDKDCNVIADSDRGQAESSISDSLDSADQPITQPQSLQDISTSDIINELASRIIDISKQWGG